jgi:hypothetical protein
MVKASYAPYVEQLSEYSKIAKSFNDIAKSFNIAIIYEDGASEEDEEEIRKSDAAILS